MLYTIPQDRSHDVHMYRSIGGQRPIRYRNPNARRGGKKNTGYFQAITNMLLCKSTDLRQFQLKIGMVVSDSGRLGRKSVAWTQRMETPCSSTFSVCGRPDSGWFIFHPGLISNNITSQKVFSHSAFVTAFELQEMTQSIIWFDFEGTICTQSHDPHPTKLLRTSFEEQVIALVSRSKCAYRKFSTRNNQTPQGRKH